MTLPNYTVFDEERYFESDDQPCVIEIKGVKFGVNICEDTWDAAAPRAARSAGAQVLLVLNASPYHLRKQNTRYDVMRERVAENRHAVDLRRTWWAARMNWCSTARPSRSTAAAR